MLGSPQHLHIAVVRFSALGDVVMVAAAIQTLREQLPNTTITWVTSPLAYSLLQGMTGVEFIVVDKPRTLRDYFGFYKKFRHHRFDVVLAMQANLRINLLYPALHAPRKIGFDRIRAREGQWLFCNEQIAFENSHLVDSFLAFINQLTNTAAHAVWRLPISAEDLFWAKNQLHTLPKPWIAIHPHASKSERNWLQDRYSAVIQQALALFGGGILLTGGNAIDERTACAQLAQGFPRSVLNLCGQTTPKKLAALLSLVDVLVAPDTGAVHIARAVNTPVVGLYAVASPTLTGPYQQLNFCVDRYPQAVGKFLHRPFETLPWNTRVHNDKAMSLVTVADVMEQLRKILG